MANNIRDIAKLAGVSVTTVSKVINNLPNVSPSTRARVQQVIQDQQFIPSHTARGLVKGKSKTIGMFLTTSLAHPFFSKVVVGLESALKKTGYDLLYLTLDWNPEYSLVRHCLSRNVEGVLIFGFQENDLNFEEIIQSEIPTVFIDLDMMGRRAGYVTSENVESIKNAVYYLHELKHRKIAFVNGHLDSYVGKQRFEGYRRGIQELGLPYFAEYISIGDFTKESGYAAMKGFMQLEEPPTAVVCSSDMIAIGVIEAAGEAGLSIPQDLSVIGFDDIELAKHTIPALTTVHQDFDTIGNQSILLLNDLINTPHSPPPALIIPTKFVIRKSCAECTR
ncbi:MAG: LacI family DNA-binding transcriptional regulator [Candidatus Cohnella colombiensis]|uniref:LacI family DNA-binding transcriptional regulator n=1 Tax=Candidatus Cohnella colombiensis TaxID=3121368 RepID=A0AA95F552_9BACL|nr:MAG: LacI family DNA-binding transcriptional regulator [Cohnella sp.]